MFKLFRQKRPDHRPLLARAAHNRAKIDLDLTPDQRASLITLYHPFPGYVGGTAVTHPEFQKELYKTIGYLDTNE